VIVLTSSESPRPYEAGFTRPLDGVVHVVMKKVNGSVALCGAGRIETQMVGRFDPEVADACPACTRLISGQAEPS
jgi:hypothetical protein